MVELPITEIIIKPRIQEHTLRIIMERRHTGEHSVHRQNNRLYSELKNYPEIKMIETKIGVTRELIKQYMDSYFYIKGNPAHYQLDNNLQLVLFYNHGIIKIIYKDIVKLPQNETKIYIKLQDNNILSIEDFLNLINMSEDFQVEDYRRWCNIYSLYSSNGMEIQYLNNELTLTILG